MPPSWIRNPAASRNSTISPTEPLEERGNTWGRVDLDDPVQVTDVDPQLKGRRRNDRAVPSFAEGSLGGSTFSDPERAVGDERRDATISEGQGELFRPGPAV